MYHYQSGSNSCNGVDDPCIQLLASRPDALLASGLAFLPSPSSCQQHYQGQQPPLGRQQQLFPRAMSSDEAKEQQQRMAPGRYSAEERRERIDKYRSKRNHRNFQKKITYACRKTLADSRPRVKGRFARNNSAEYYTDAEADFVQAPGISGSESPPVNDVPVEYCDRKSMMMNVDVGTNGNKQDIDTTSMPEWWPAMQEALPTASDLDNLYDEDMLAAYLGVSSISLYSPSYSSSASGQ